MTLGEIIKNLEKVANDQEDTLGYKQAFTLAQTEAMTIRWNIIHEEEGVKVLRNDAGYYIIESQFGNTLYKSKERTQGKLFE